MSWLTDEFERARKRMAQLPDWARPGYVVDLGKPVEQVPGQLEMEFEEDEQQ